MKNRWVTFGISMMLGSVVVLAQAPIAGTKTDPLLGTWKINPEKSTPTPPAGVVSVRQYILLPDGSISSIFATVGPQGNPGFLQSTWKYDGKDYPMYTQASLPAFSTSGAKLSTSMYKAVDAYTTELTQKDGSGKPLFTGVRTRVVSKDGMTLTDTSKGTNAQGEKVDTVTVFDKVK